MSEETTRSVSPSCLAISVTDWPVLATAFIPRESLSPTLGQKPLELGHSDVAWKDVDIVSYLDRCDRLEVSRSGD